MPLVVSSEAGNDMNLCNASGIASRIAVIAFATLGCCSERSTDSSAPPRAKFSTTQPVGVGPVAAIWYEDSGFPLPMTKPAEPHHLIVGIWSDGTVAWSADRRFGGSPYTRGQIAVDKVGIIVDRLDATGFFDLTRQVNFGPDSSYTVVAAHARGANQWVGSWHDPSTPGIIVTERGRQSAAYGPGDPPSAAYKHFLQVWADTRTAIESSIPPDGVVTTSVDSSVYKLGR
jgi:hypothetical protein